MTKKDIMKLVAKRVGITIKDTEKVADALFEEIGDQLKKNSRVSIHGFGTFKVRQRRERTGRNPSTGEVTVIPAGKVPAFRAGKAFREKIN